MSLYNPDIFAISTQSTPQPTKIYTYRIEKEGYPIFDLNVKEYYVRDIKYYYLYVGKKESERCINITIHEKPEYLYGKDKSHIAKMSWVENYKSCALYDDLSGGDKGAKHLIRGVFEYMINTYKWVTTIELSDGSYFMCKNVDNKSDERKVMLAYYNIAIYGKTWYEMNFNAYLEDNSIYNTYTKNINKLYDQKEKIYFEQFIYDYKINENIDILEKYYVPGKTYSEFFNDLKNDDKDKYCWRISKWIQPFIKSIIGPNISIDDWIIDLKSIPKYEISIRHIDTKIEKAYRGGKNKRKTKKNTKSKEHKLPPGFNQTPFDLEYNDHWPY